MDQANCHSDLDVRYGFLLQPIKDLTKNFDIDLVSRLGDYLSEIAKITILFNDGVTTLNFAEAALIIQGSASVYSQKVEYLYRLTFSVLDLLGNKKQQLQQSSETDEPTQSSSNEEKFLTLDDINECNNTCMRHDDADGPNARDIAPMTPSVLMRLDDADRAERPLISRNGEILGSMSDFRMNTSCLHPAGIMLFDMSHPSPLHQSFSNSNRQQQAVETDAARTDGGLLSDHLLDDPDSDEGFPTDHLGFDDDDNNKDDELLPARNQKSRTRHRKTDVQPTSSILEDAWKLLDPHKPSHKSAEKSFRKGKVFKLPDIALDTHKKRKQQGFPDVILPKMSFGELCNCNYFSRSRTKPVYSFKASELFTDFETLFWEMKKKSRNKRLHRKTSLYQLTGENDRDEENHRHIQDDHVDDDEADDVEPPDIDLSELLHQNAVDTTFDNRAVTNEYGSDVFDVVLSNSYEELVQRYVEGFMNSARLYLQDTALAQRVAEWENKIVPRLQEEERRRPFDIHEYGSEVIRRLDALGGSVNPVSFCRLVEGRAQYEVCRYLLATLQLANFGNVELGCTAQLTVDTATCKLLSHRRHFEELTDYRVPSFGHTTT